MRARLATPEGARLAGEPPLYGRPAPSLVSTHEQHVQWVSRWCPADRRAPDPDYWSMAEPSPEVFERFVRIHLLRPAAGWRYAPLHKRAADGSLVPESESESEAEGGVSDRRVFSIARQTTTSSNLSDAKLEWLSACVHYNDQPDAAWVDARAVLNYLAYTRRNSRGVLENEAAVLDAYMPARLENKRFMFSLSPAEVAPVQRPCFGSERQRAAWRAVVAFVRTGSSAYKIPRNVRPGSRPRALKPEFQQACAALAICKSTHQVDYVLGMPLSHMMLVCAGSERLAHRDISVFGSLSSSDLMYAAVNESTVFDVACDAWRRCWRSEPLPESALVQRPLEVAWPAGGGPLQLDGTSIDMATARMFDRLAEARVFRPTAHPASTHGARRTRALALLPAAALSGFVQYVRSCERACGPGRAAHATSSGFSMMHAVAACVRAKPVLEYILNSASNPIASGAASSAAATALDLNLVYATDEMRTLGVRAGDTPLTAALRHGVVEHVRMLLEKGASASARDSATGETALHVLAEAAVAHPFGTLLSMCDLLMPKLSPADVRARTRNEMGEGDATASDRSALDELLERPIESVVRITLLGRFVDAGADVGACDARGLTPLHRAATRGHADVALFLLIKGASREALYDGKTPLALVHEMQQERTLVGADDDANVSGYAAVEDVLS